MFRNKPVVKINRHHGEPIEPPVYCKFHNIDDNYDYRPVDPYGFGDPTPYPSKKDIDEMNDTELFRNLLRELIMSQVRTNMDLDNIFGRLEKLEKYVYDDEDDEIENRHYGY